MTEFGKILIGLAIISLCFVVYALGDLWFSGDLATDAYPAPKFYGVDSTTFNTLDQSFSAYDSLNARLERVSFMLDDMIADSNTEIIIIEHQLDSIKTILDSVLISMESPPLSDFDESL